MRKGLARRPSLARGLSGLEWRTRILTSDRRRATGQYPTDAFDLELTFTGDVSRRNKLRSGGDVSW